MLATAMLSPYKMFYKEEFQKALDEISPDDIQRVASYYLTNPSVISVIASGAAIAANEEYLKSLGEYKKF